MKKKEREIRLLGIEIEHLSSLNHDVDTEKSQQKRES